jgi:predicted nuclease of predicted toxin-antitoxin system
VLRVYLDADVDVLLADILTARGFDCEVARDVGLVRAIDEVQLTYATREGRILITHNRGDFQRLAAEWWTQGKDHAGIILAVRRFDTYEVARRVLALLLSYDQQGWKNCVLVG